ncbi:uncharacterized protein BDV14DRAFT_168936 [Aspergillus stella-maris]|uniref:uncharacterized protein n=1 Tax=Aspergillus stella-maris TaxID=1810926 RepID=UPI003CCE0925
MEISKTGVRSALGREEREEGEKKEEGEVLGKGDAEEGHQRGRGKREEARPELQQRVARGKEWETERRVSLLVCALAIGRLRLGRRCLCPLQLTQLIQGFHCSNSRHGLAVRPSIAARMVRSFLITSYNKNGGRQAPTPLTATAAMEVLSHGYARYMNSYPR